MSDIVSKVWKKVIFLVLYERSYALYFSFVEHFLNNQKKWAKILDLSLNSSLIKLFVSYYIKIMKESDFLSALWKELCLICSFRRGFPKPKKNLWRILNFGLNSSLIKSFVWCYIKSMKESHFLGALWKELSLFCSFHRVLPKPK